MCICDYCGQKSLELTLGLNGKLANVYYECTNPECPVEVYGNSYTSRVNKIIKMMSRSK
jgi:hypothetical protein